MSATPTDSGNGATSTASDVSPANPELIKIKLDTLPEELIATLMLQNMGALELTSMTRYDMIDGIETIYQPIKDIEDVSKTYAPSKIVNSNPPIWTGDAGYTPFNWTSFNMDKDLKTPVQKPMEYSTTADAIGINIPDADLGVNEIVEIEIMSTDPGYHNYTSRSNLLSQDKTVTANWSSSSNWDTSGTESFAHVNKDTLSQVAGAPVASSGEAFSPGDVNKANHFFQPQHIVHVDEKEYESLEASQ
jgi:hypothetical protein